MSQRLHAAWQGPRRKLVVYLTAGDPDLATSVELVCAVAEAGADIVELGMPFSDPTADGPAIRAAMERAIARGVKPKHALEVVAQVRARGCNVPIVLFGYYNPVFVAGPDAFCAAAASSGADGLLLVDLPEEEVDEMAGPARKHGLDIVPLVAPTTTLARMEQVRDRAPAFVYYVSMTGVTGGALAAFDEVEARVATVSRVVGRPVAVGFGISTPADVARVGAFAEGVVVGTALVNAIADGEASGAVQRARILVASLAQALPVRG